MCYIKEISNDGSSQSVVLRVCFLLLVLFGTMFFSGTKAQTLRQAISHHTTAHSPAKAHRKMAKTKIRPLVPVLPSKMQFDNSNEVLGPIVVKAAQLRTVPINVDYLLSSRLVCLAFDPGLLQFPRVASGCKDWFWMSEVKAFPNPISLYAGFNLRLAPARLGEYFVQVTDTEGKIVVEKFVDIRVPGQIEHFDAGQFEDSGEYLVSLIAQCDGTVYSNRLVVQ
jgi:hypothetical protein